MTEQEKVIKELSDALESYEMDDYSENAGDYIAVPPMLIADAIALLKAQEPMKPTRYQEGRWFKTWHCGACGGTLVFCNGEDKQNYCTDCGQAVKWDG